MAVFYLENKEDFLMMMRAVGIQRYILAIEKDEDRDEWRLYLSPFVTSRHAHTYVFTTNREEDVEDIKRRWMGRILTCKKVEIARW